MPKERAISVLLVVAFVVFVNTQSELLENGKRLVDAGNFADAIDLLDR